MGIVRGVVRGLSQDSVKGGPGTGLAKSVLWASQGVGAFRGWSTLGGKAATESRSSVFLLFICLWG